MEGAGLFYLDSGKPLGFAPVVDFLVERGWYVILLAEFDDA